MVFRVADALESGGPEQSRVGGSEPDEVEKPWIKDGELPFFSPHQIIDRAPVPPAPTVLSYNLPHPLTPLHPCTRYSQ